MQVTSVPAICVPDREYDPPVYQVVRSSQFICEYFCNLQSPFYTGEWFITVVLPKNFQNLPISCHLNSLNIFMNLLVTLCHPGCSVVT